MEKLFLVFDEDDYFYKYENNCVYPYRKNEITLFFIRICNKFKLPIFNFMLSKKLKKNLRNCEVVITDFICTPSLVKYFKGKHINHYLYLMNTMNEYNSKLIKYFDKNNIYSFDIHDCNIYGWNYLSTPYSENIPLPKLKIKYDTVFLGRAKNRQNSILELYNLLETKGLKNLFMILNADNNIPDNLKIDKYIDYSDYLKFVAESKCIIEIINEKQSSKSLRSVEALFFNKKLITNCISIKNEPFYHSNNIFILGVDNIDDLNDFIQKPFIHFDDIKKEYTLKNWINNFGGNI